jgi:hypothetical protein
MPEQSNYAQAVNLLKSVASAVTGGWSVVYGRSVDRFGDVNEDYPNIWIEPLTEAVAYTTALTQVPSFTVNMIFSLQDSVDSTNEQSEELVFEATLHAERFLNRIQNSDSVSNLTGVSISPFYRFGNVPVSGCIISFTLVTIDGVTDCLV